MAHYRIVDLFAGIGGLKQGVVSGLTLNGHTSETVFTSEIKKPAIRTLHENWPELTITGDITQVAAGDVPVHDILLAGFPCQPFSEAGKRQGFSDSTRGTLFFDIVRILKHHQPEYFILENVEGLVNHDPYPKHEKHPLGRTLTTILETLHQLGYKTDWRVLEATSFGVPQARKRIFITGSKSHQPNLEKIQTLPTLSLSNILEHNIKEPDPKIVAFSNLLKTHYPNMGELEGKIFRDWRGGEKHLHSWNINLKGETTTKERHLLETLRTESKKTMWKEHNLPRGGEGYCLNVKEIHSILPEYSTQEITQMVTKLVKQKYLKQENNRFRIQSGRLTAPISYIYGANQYAGTLAATDADHMGVIDNNNLRRFTFTELKRLFGFPEYYKIPTEITPRQVYDLFGNSVVVPVAQQVTRALIL